MSNLTRQTTLEHELDRWIPLLVKHLDPERIILFGSLNQENVEEWSDIDLVIVKETKQSFLNRIKEALLIIQPKVGVDLLIYTPKEFQQLAKEKRFFRDEIIGKGKLIYERR